MRVWTAESQQLRRASRDDILPPGARLVVPPAKDATPAAAIAHGTREKRQAAQVSGGNHSLNEVGSSSRSQIGLSVSMQRSGMHGLQE